MSLTPLPRPTIALRYTVALFLPLLALGITRRASPLMEQHAFDLFLGAVFFSATFGGLDAGLFTAIVSMLCEDYFLMPPINAFSVTIADFGRLTAFAFVAIISSSLISKLRNVQKQLESAQKDLERRIEQRTYELSQANQSLTKEIEHRLQAEQAILQISGREQKRLGQDLHDGLCQTLAGVRLLLGALKKKLAAHREETSDFEHIEGRLQEALLQADTVSRGLYPVDLEANGLASALRELALRMSQVYGVDCRFVGHQPAVLEKSLVATHLYRVAQEAVMNAIKGGKAQKIRIRFFSWLKTIYLTIADNGIGISHPPAHQGMGLQLMSYRARMMNATLQFRKRKLGGTLVICFLSSQPAEVIYAE